MPTLEGRTRRSTEVNRSKELFNPSTRYWLPVVPAETSTWDRRWSVQYQPNAASAAAMPLIQSLLDSLGPPLRFCQSTVPCTSARGTADSWAVAGGAVTVRRRTNDPSTRFIPRKASAPGEPAQNWDTHNLSHKRTNCECPRSV